MQGYNDGLTSLPQEEEYAEPKLSPELAAKEDFAESEREDVTKHIFEEGLGLAGVALLKQVSHPVPSYACACCTEHAKNAASALIVSLDFLHKQVPPLPELDRTHS